jgi:hypothetical protein
VTDEVSNDDKSKEVSDEQFLNILSIFSTFKVLKFEKSNEEILEQL